MSSQKLKKPTADTHYKKYDASSDIVPLAPTGFIVGTSNQDKEVFMLEFLHSSRNHNNVDIILGSYVITHKMAKNLVKMLNETLDQYDTMDESAPSVIRVVE